MGKLEEILEMPRNNGPVVGLLPWLDESLGKSFNRAVIKNYTFQPPAALDFNRPDSGYRIRDLSVRVKSPGVNEWVLSLQVGRMVLDSSLAEGSGDAEIKVARVMSSLQKAILEWEKCYQRSLSAPIGEIQGNIAKVPDRNVASNSVRSWWHVLNCVFELIYLD